MANLDPTWTQPAATPPTPTRPTASPPPTPPTLPPPPSATPPTPPERTPLMGVLKTSAVFAGSAIAVYLVIVGPSLAERGWYILTNFQSRKQPTQVINTAAETNSLSGAAISSALASLPVPAAVADDPTAPASRSGTGGSGTRTSTALASNSLGLEENLLVIPKLRKRVPVIWNSSSDEATMLANLQRGVAHYGFTSLPNDKNGNVFISGHSSFYWWDKGKYKTVFANINQLVPGDQLFIQYNSTVYLYEVTGNVTVKPSDVSITEPTPTPVLSLMTCVPVGTALNRLVVQSKLVRTYAAEVQQATAVAPLPTLPSTVASR